jgi:hydrophobic/amphiphilic exporter-1 (mainly G- bacteria), HAE1 family
MIRISQLRCLEWTGKVIPVLLDQPLLGCNRIISFTINVLSLLGLVLAIGIVVDDAIVVVEAVQNNIESGMDPKSATMKAMDEVTAPVIATTLVLVAVFTLTCLRHFV